MGQAGETDRNKSKRVFARSKAIEFRQVTHWTSSRVAYCSVARWQCCTCNLLCVGRISRRRRCAAAAQRRVLSPARVARVSPSMSSCRRSIVDAHYKLLEAIGLHGLQRWYRPLICWGMSSVCLVFLDKGFDSSTIARFQHRETT